MNKQEIIESIKKRPQGYRPRTKASGVTKTFLEELYITKHMTMQEIGNLLDLSRQRIYQLLKKFDIDTTHAERFTVTCPQCLNPFETTRKRYNSVALRYCKSSCYHLHRAYISSYNPHRQGQRIARAVMSAHLGRPLSSSEVVHHIDGDCDNNILDNLILFTSQSEHLRYHHNLRIESAKPT